MSKSKNVLIFGKNNIPLCIQLTTCAMNKSEKKIAQAAERFAKRWEGRGYEKGESQLFWTELLTEVFGISEPSTFIRFEKQVKLDATNFIDAHIPSTRVMIEQKSLGKDLRAPIIQSDGKPLTPFQQAKRYITNLPLSEHPRWIVTCNFSTFLVYDMEHPTGEPFEIQLADLGKQHYRLRFLVETGADHLKREEQVSMQAGVIVGKLYEALLKEYQDPTNPESLRSLNVLCVRLVFCLYSEDAGIFGQHDMFHDYLARYDTMEMRGALIRLFQILNTPIAERDQYLPDYLKAFPYASGGLFEGDIEIPRFNEEIRSLLLRHASLEFDWSQISPTIFGAVFESTLNPDTRRSGGMHYTSVENIHKVIDPLFLDDLRTQLDDILAEPVVKQRQRRLRDYQDHLASLTFLDPACGSGNFLTETYLSLRKLENRAIRALYEGHSMFIGGEDFVNPVKVSIYQFHGIEINDFAVTVAATALWISEAQMLAETERIVSHDFEFLPLKDYPNIVEANALRIDWRSLFNQTTDQSDTSDGHPHSIVVGELSGLNELSPENQPTTDTNPINPHNPPTIKLPDYIMGNPPFIGARMATAEQKQDLINVFGAKWKNIGNLDYVCGWYKKAAELMRGTAIKTALVSTNSICQGEQVANLWQPLMQDGIVINFAHRTFRWDSEAKTKAHVHCVIVGFSFEDNKDKKDKLLFDNGQATQVNHINAYLIDGPDVFVGSRNKPICDVPEIGIGNKPIDGGHYLFEKEEMEEFIKLEPKSEQYFRPWYGSVEFIHQKPRYCLWLGDCSPAELRSMPHCLKRVEAVRETRLASKSEGTRKLADRPTRFHVENMPKGNYIIVPSVSSERRHYVPMGFMSPDVFASNLVLIIPDASLYHFGVLESSIHMAWMRVVCGRLKSDYRYSKDVVYNNFPWPEATEQQRERIAQTAQAILDARALYPDSSLADLYDPVTMPQELLKAHRDNDRAVLAAYNLPTTLPEPDLVAHLFTLHTHLTQQQP